MSVVEGNEAEIVFIRLRPLLPESTETSKTEGNYVSAIKDRPGHRDITLLEDDADRAEVVGLATQHSGWQAGGKQLLDYK